MPRSDAFRAVQRMIVSESGALSRRDVLRGATVAAGTGLLAGLSLGQKNRPMPKVAIVGAGLAGLVCADRLRAKGIAAIVYEANPGRIGGRCWSQKDIFPGQVAELGGEFIDTGHKTMLAYAREFGLSVEDVTKVPGDVAYYFRGRHFSEAEVVAEFKELSRRMQPDLHESSGAPTFFTSNEADRRLDHTDLATYLDNLAPDLPLIRWALDEAYVAEYGLECHQQSALNLLLFIKISRRSRFLPFGVFSDERYHIVQGNDGFVAGIADRLPRPVETGAWLERLSRNGLGQYELRFKGVKTPATADFVVLALPFTTLRDVELDPSLSLSADKIRAIQTLGYGNNAKTMVGFHGQPWQSVGSNGSAYADLAEVQTTWQTNPSRAGATSIITDYAGGDRGATLHRRTTERQVEAWLAEFDRVYPGALASATGVARREHWPSSPYVKGSYTCYLPGQFTGLAGLEGQPCEGIKFAGEHADSFYSWQGFMEGACLSGLRAADEVLADL